ncbi:MAG: DMT family transporter [Mesorhizobium sp.]|nr:MAG: DMT family transporter [Mesorhizobium sp.]TGV18130.1 DMT family transporter [Mesorhizobium sp. M4B.F.Ca.ET.143.01.1.1]
MTAMRNAYFSSILGAGFALLAALSNGTVGVLSRSAFKEGLDHTAVAFWRCAIAFSLLSIIILLRSGGLARLVSVFTGSWKIAVCSALGIFTLYHFETQAFTYAPIPLVAILVFAGGLGAIALDILILKERVTTRKAFAMTMVFLGGYFVIAGDGLMTGSIIGVSLALIAGLGYASFIFAWKFFKLRSSLETFWWFLAYGLVMLAVPYAWSGAPIPSVNALPSLLSLGVIPSFFGFYCTILALQHIEAYKTQVIESSEPFFSALFAAALFGEWLTGPGMFAALAIIVGALTTSMPERRAVSMQVRPIGEED